MMTTMMMLGGSRGGGGGVDGDPSKGIEDELSLPIVLAERVRKAVGEADSFKLECGELGRQVDFLADMLRCAVRRVTAAAAPYERPVRRIAAESSRALERALLVVRRCRRSGVLRRVVAITTGSADVRRAQSLLEASVGDLRWLLSVYSAPDDAGTGLILSLPPIASTDPNLSYVWGCLAAVQMAAAPSDRAEAANALANLAWDSDRNKQLIFAECGVPPLLSLVKDGSSADAQLAAVSALTALATSRDRVALMVADLAVPVIVSVLANSPMKVQSKLASLISQMAAHHELAQEEFARENAIRPLVSLLSFEVPLDDPRASPNRAISIYSIVQINRDQGRGATLPSPLVNSGSGVNSGSSVNSGSGGGSVSKGGGGQGSSSLWLRGYYQQQHKEREKESPELKREVKMACSHALWMLAQGCLSNSRKITETKGLLCLSKLIETEKEHLQINCLMTVMEITAAAEVDAELRRAAFKTNSPAAKSVVDQMLKLVLKGNNPSLQIPAIKAIGSLARTFSARDTRFLSPLVVQLSHWNPDVAAEAATALAKFAGPENFLCIDHCRAIIEYSGVPQIMRLLRSSEKTRLPALILLCCLASHVPDNEALEGEKALQSLESIARTAAFAQDASLRELLPKAIYQLELYRGGAHTHRHTSTNGTFNYRGAAVY